MSIIIVRKTTLNIEIMYPPVGFDDNKYTKNYKFYADNLRALV